MSPSDISSPYTPPATIVSDKPNNNLVLAIISTLCCCVPTGIAAIVFAAQVDSKWAAGDQQGALEAAEKSKLWSYISIGAGIVVSVAYVALQLAAGTTS